MLRITIEVQPPGSNGVIVPNGSGTLSISSPSAYRLELEQSGDQSIIAALRTIADSLEEIQRHPNHPANRYLIP